MIRGEASTSPQSSWYVHVKKKREKLLWTARIEDKGGADWFDCDSWTKRQQHVDDRSDVGSNSRVH